MSKSDFDGLEDQDFFNAILETGRIPDEYLPKRPILSEEEIQKKLDENNAIRAQRYCSLIILEAFRVNASEIYFSPKEDGAKIYYLLDGEWRMYDDVLSKEEYAGILKCMCEKLNIDEDKKFGFFTVDASFTDLCISGFVETIPYGKIMILFINRAHSIDETKEIPLLD